MADCVAGSGLSVVDGALTLDPVVVSPVVLLDVETDPVTRQFDNTRSPGNFTAQSVSVSAGNTTGRRLSVIALQYVGQAEVASAGANQGRIQINSGWATRSPVTPVPVWKHGANFDMGTYRSGFSTRRFFTQTDMSTSATAVIVPFISTVSASPVLAPGQTAYVESRVTWSSDLWNDEEVGFDSRDYARFPYTRIQLIGFPSD